MKPLGPFEHSSLASSNPYNSVTLGSPGTGSSFPPGSVIQSHLSPKNLKPLTSGTSPLMKQLAQLQKQGVGQMVLQPVLQTSDLQVQRLSAGQGSPYRELPRRQQQQANPISIDITTKPSIPEVAERQEETITPHTAEFKRTNNIITRTRGKSQTVPGSVLAPSNDQSLARLHEKRLQKILKHRPPGRASPSTRGGTAVGQPAGLLDVTRSSMQHTQKNKSRKFEDVRSKLEGYHDPVSLMKKMEELEKVIRDQKKTMDALKQENAQLRQENERNKSINKKLFDEMTTLDQDTSPRHSVSTILQDPRLSAQLPAFPQYQQRSAMGQRKHSRVSTIGELHSIYQDLFLTDMKKEMSRAKDQLVHFREKSSSAQKQITNLKKSNYSLSSTVKRYRRMMQQVQAAAQPKRHQVSMDDLETRSVHSSITESAPSIHMQLISGERPVNKSFAPSVSVADRGGGAQSTVSAAMIESAKLEKFDKAITNLSKDSLWLMDILVSFLSELKSIMRCQFVNAFIFDTNFSRLIREIGMARMEQQNLHLQKLFFEGQWIDVVCIVEGDFHEPKFTGIDDVRYGIVQPGFLVEPIKAYSTYSLENVTDLTGVEIATGIRTLEMLSSKRPGEHIWMGIQCVGKQSGATELQSERHKAKHAGGKGFHRVDSLLLKVLCNWLSQRVQVWLTQKQNIAKERVVQGAIEMTSCITVQKTHKHMIVTMKRLVPIFFGFYDCGILVYNPESNDLFTVSDSNQDNSLISGGGKHRSSAVSIASIATQEQKLKMADETGAKSRIMRKIKQKRESVSSFNEQVLEEAVKTRQSQSLLEMESHIQNHEIITFPSSIGVTGYVFKHRSVYFSNKPAKDAKWNPDIDNLSSAGDVRNFMIGSLVDSQNRPVGVIQLINKRDDKNITEIDQRRFQKMRRFLGICFENTNITHLTLGITTGVKDIMDHVVRKFDNMQRESDKLGTNPIASLEKHLEVLRRKITELNERKVYI